MGTSDIEAPEIKLHCFNDGPAPPPVVEGWRRFLGFPPQAREAFWAVLGPALTERADADSKQRLAAFCREHALAEQHAVAAVKACDVLLWQASALDLDGERFCQDLEALSDGQSEGRQILLSKYDTVKGELRRRIVEGSLADHGKVLVGLDWRVDHVVSSDRGARLNAPVILLTLRYREADRTERITLQLTPETLQELRLVTERIGK
jgi:hypothetical protein